MIPREISKKQRITVNKINKTRFGQSEENISPIINPNIHCPSIQLEILPHIKEKFLRVAELQYPICLYQNLTDDSNLSGDTLCFY